jgi:predicted HD phosphohydrolase/DNA-directed RNA polymerase subunit RPC12/RpoP
MLSKHCPGSLGFVQPKPEIFRCPGCGREVEIWSDEAMADCPVCSKTVFRPGMQSCLDWCKYAKECVGDEKLSQYTRMKGLLRKQSLSRAMEDYFGADARRIRHAQRTAEYAEMILAQATGADPNIVIAAALLHDIGIKNAEEKYGSADPAHQEAEGPPVARGILKKLDYPEEFIKEVCDMIGHHHHPRADETTNFKVLYDADQFVNAEESASKPSSGAGSSDTPGYMPSGGAKLAVNPTGLEERRTPAGEEARHV